MKSIFKILSRFLSGWHVYLIKSLSYDSKSRRQLPINLDYVRYKTLELCADEVREKKVKGQVAELGVYKGDFTIKLNLLFPDKKLYLFDTFSGFDAKDLNHDSEKYNTADQDFSDTNEAYVLSRLKHPDMCIVKKGYFPKTAEGLKETFSFVSIDADLYEPILAGLQFFYPALSKGGYIFIHDFNNSEYLGARDAVMQYCKEEGISFVPIPDIGGSVVISK